MTTTERKRLVELATKANDAATYERTTWKTGHLATYLTRKAVALSFGVELATL